MSEDASKQFVGCFHPSSSSSSSPWSSSSYSSASSSSYPLPPSVSQRLSLLASCSLFSSSASSFCSGSSSAMRLQRRCSSSGRAHLQRTLSLQLLSGVLLLASLLLLLPTTVEAELLADLLSQAERRAEVATPGRCQLHGQDLSAKAATSTTPSLTTPPSSSITTAAPANSASSSSSSLPPPPSGRPNFFLTFPLTSEHFGSAAVGTLESVLFQYPSANVFVVSPGLPDDQFDEYVREGYCVASLPIDAAAAAAVLGSVVTQDVGVRFVQQSLSSSGAGSPESTLTSFIPVLNAVVLALQLLYGGVSLPMDGLLLNPLELLLPKQLFLSSTVLLFERLLAQDGPPEEGALQTEDFEKSWLPRAHTDRADGRTAVCMQAECPRSIPAGDQLGRALLDTWLHGSVGGGVPPDSTIDVNGIATALYRLYVQKRPEPVPFTVQGSFVFNHEVVLLPYWLMVEPHFTDGWKSFGGKDDVLSQYSQLYAPRARREAADWTLISSAKLWLPLGFGPSSARNIMPRSAVDLALRYFGLGIAPLAHRRKGFGAKVDPPSARRLRSVQDVQQEFGLEGSVDRAKEETLLPGTIGGFRTFRHLRLVGRGEGPSPTRRYRVTIRVANDSPQSNNNNDNNNNKDVAALRLFCRRQNRPAEVGSQAGESAAYRSCQEAIRNKPATSAGQPLFDYCGLPADLNAALTLLAYESVEGLSNPPTTAMAADLDHRLPSSELDKHFASLVVHATPGCDGAGQEETSSSSSSSSSAGAALTVRSAALLDDVQEHITVIAHCAERCYLLDRLALTFREAYDRLKIIVTCECSEGEDCPEPVAKEHSEIPFLTVVSVPYDFGLSRGKSLLAKMASTEFALVLDDDFTHSFHSCLECMLWRMRSRHHSLWKPFDVVGFPVLEDERLFGAFRGKLRVTKHQLFLEPLPEQLTPDGCARVDICPMVFLARTSRFRHFKFQESLSVGEHEQFFYSNAYMGMQVAVCWDSSFPHFRVNTMSAGYVKRRERMPELMQSAFKNLGFERAMFLFKKYDHTNMEDYDDLLDKNVPPWYISDDSCGPKVAPPVPFAQVFVVLFSSSDERGSLYREVLRGHSGGDFAWLRKLAAEGEGLVRWMFAVPEADNFHEQQKVLQEQAQHRDILLIPATSPLSASSSTDATTTTTTEQLLRVFAAMQDFQFRWLIISQQDVFVHADRLANVLQQLPKPGHMVLGDWTVVNPPSGGQPHFLLQQPFFAISRDLFALLTWPPLNGLLRSSGEDPQYGDLSMAYGALNAWFRILSIQRIPIPGLHLRKTEPIDRCPTDTLALSPLTPEQLHILSVSPAQAGC